MTWSTTPPGAWLHALAALVMSSPCPGCRRTDPPSASALCAGCADELAAACWRPGPRWTAPDPAPPGCPDVVAAAPATVLVRALVTAYKDEGQRALLPVLGARLAESLAVATRATAAAGDHDGPTLVVAVPSSASARRRRGADPLADLAGWAFSAVAAAGADVAPVRRGLLAQTRRLQDQSGLDAVGRAANLHGALRVRHPQDVRGRACIVVDDVLTTGATLTEAARALRLAGARQVVAATVCATERRHLPPPPGERRVAIG